MQTLHLLEEKRRKKEAERLRQPATPLLPSSRSHGTFSLLALEGLRLCCAQWHPMTNDSDKYLPDPPEPRLANPRVDAEKAPMMLCAPAYKVLEEKGFLCKPLQGAVGSALANSKTTLQKSQHWAPGEPIYLGLVCPDVDATATVSKRHAVNLPAHLPACPLSIFFRLFLRRDERTYPCILLSMCLSVFTLHASYISDGDPYMSMWVGPQYSTAPLSKRTLKVTLF